MLHVLLCEYYCLLTNTHFIQCVPITLAPQSIVGPLKSEHSRSCLPSDNLSLIETHMYCSNRAGKDGEEAKCVTAFSHSNVTKFYLLTINVVIKYSFAIFHTYLPIKFDLFSIFYPELSWTKNYACLSVSMNCAQIIIQPLILLFIQLRIIISDEKYWKTCTLWNLGKLNDICSPS